MRYSIWLFIFAVITCLLSISIDRFSFHAITAPILWVGLLACVFRYAPQVICRLLCLVAGEVIMTICLADIFCQINFHTELSPQMLSTILYSNREEASEFFATFVDWDSILELRICIILLLMMLFPLFLTTIATRWTERIVAWLPPCFLLVLALFEVQPTLHFVSLCNAADQRLAESLIFQKYNKEMHTPVHRLVYSWCVYIKSEKTLQDIRCATINAEVNGCSHLSQHIVLIIGESYNKHHSSLYGYHYNTTPYQEARMKQNELYLFSDVVSPWNITSNVFIDMFSLWDNSAEDDISRYPLFPVLFRQSGYTVDFYSNQYVFSHIGEQSANQAGNFFLNDQVLSDTLFSWRNEVTMRYDKDLIELVRSRVKNKEWKGRPTLDIIHLKGQHFDYKKRYPKEYQIFDKLLENDGSMPTEQRIIAEYDNATLYNDAILESIMSMMEDEDAIIIFVSDHGEEVYDVPDIHGRQFGIPTKWIARNEYEVPMWIWCSKQYQENHALVVEAIATAINRPCQTDDMPQLLCFLAGIRSKYLQESRVIISPHYRPKKRIIWGNIDYDQ